MKLEDAVDIIREKISLSIDKSLSRMGLFPNKEFASDQIENDLLADRKRMKDILDNLQQETGDYISARDKLLEELTFTLFNRLAGLKVIEANGLQPEVITIRAQHGGRSFGHKLWLEQNPEKKKLPLEGLQEYIYDAFKQMSAKIQLYSPGYLYDFLPDAYSLKEIINEFNNIEYERWQSDDIMGWLYESYNRKKREAFKNSEAKIEYNWVSVTSQIYTPRWVVEFILNNSLGKLWLEMQPDSNLKNDHDIANCPEKPVQKTKPVKEIKVIDPAVGSGNFLLYAFDLFYEMYEEEGKYPLQEIPRLIIENNLYGIDLDDRSVQIARLGLFIKALKKNKDVQITRMNIVSSDFYLPEYGQVSSLFERLIQAKETVGLLKDIWEDLRVAYKFGSLIQIEEKINKISSELKRSGSMSLWGTSELTFWDDWKENVFKKIIEIINKYSSDTNGNMKFFKNKTKDSMIFADVISQKYDVAVANPPYTDSGSYGSELKQFIAKNYKKPLSFYSNLYAVFLKRCSDLINENGKLGMIHPLTFMFIKSYQDMRKYILKSFHINIFVEYGLSDLFGSIMVDPAFYVLEKNSSENETLFISLNQYTRTPEENFKEQYTKNALNNYTRGKKDKNVYLLDQKKLKLIEGYPFIYWITDNLREKFKGKCLKEYSDVIHGMWTGNNIRFLRYIWEVDKKDISEEYESDSRKWIKYAKGGPYNKWFGNIWLVVNWENEARELTAFKGSGLYNKKFLFKKGIACSRSSTKGSSYRILPENHLFDVASSSIILKNYEKKIELYILALINSKLVEFVNGCLNPTVNTTEGDVKKIPVPTSSEGIKETISSAAQKCVEIKKHLYELSIIEPNYQKNPIIWVKEKFSNYNVCSLIKKYLDYENELNTQIYLNEALIDELIFQVYQLNEEDKEMILTKEGIPVGSYPILNQYSKVNNQILPEVEDYIKKVEVKQLGNQELGDIKEKVLKLYQDNYTLEEICKKLCTNPISVSGIIKENQVLPQRRCQEIAQDLLFDLVREILSDDQDGIIPLVNIGGEKTLQNMLYQKMAEKGFGHQQVEQIKQILGTSFENYLEKYFFRDLSNRLNLFMYLPKTPFIWHLSSGENQGFEVYISIYKWSKDKLYRLKSVYIEKKESSLKNRLSDLSGNKEELELKYQKEKELIQNQLNEIKKFKQNIDEILMTDYDPKLDDGVGKNIAPLQQKSLLKYEVLKKKELKKYLNADW